MAWFTDLLKLAVALYALWELRALRRAVEGIPTPSPVEAAAAKFREVVDEIEAQVVGPTLPHVLTDEEELKLEREHYGTQGAQSGYVVNSYWLEQDARDAYAEEEALGV